MYKSGHSKSLFVPLLMLMLNKIRKSQLVAAVPVLCRNKTWFVVFFFYFSICFLGHTRSFCSDICFCVLAYTCPYSGRLIADFLFTSLSLSLQFPVHNVNRKYYCIVWKVSSKGEEEYYEKKRMLFMSAFIVRFICDSYMKQINACRY